MPAVPLADLRDTPAGGANCWQCRYFGISWDTARPYSCRLMGFKSKVLPSIEVLRADGQVCRGFVAKCRLRHLLRRSLPLSLLQNRQPVSGKPEAGLSSFRLNNQIHLYLNEF